MHKAVLTALFLFLAVLRVPGSAYAQVPGQPPAAQNPGTAAAPQAQQPQPQPEIPKKESIVEIKDGKLSVDLSDADLGAVMNQIGAKMNVPVQVSGSVFSRKVSTKFSGLEIERGIERLLSLAKESNYLIRYNEAGALSSISLYADNPAPSGIQQAPGVQPSRLPANPLFRRRYRRFTPPPQPGQQPQAQPPAE